MNTNLVSESNNQNNSQLGEMLRAEREKQNLTTKQIGAALNLPDRFINYLETGDFDKLPGHTFARGYIRNYARFLGLNNAEELVALFDSYTGTNAFGSEVNDFKQIKQLKHISNSIYWLISFIVGLIIVGVVFILWQNHSNNVIAADITESLPATVVATAPLDSNQSTLPLIDNSESLATTDTNTNSLTEQTTTALTSVEDTPATSSIETTDSTEPTVAAEPVVANNKDEGHLQAEFSANCWVTVNDATGKTLVDKLMTKGTRLDIKGKPPLELTLGSPGAVVATYNGKAITINAKQSAIYRAKLGQ